MSNGPRRRRRPLEHNRLHVARVRREYVAGEQVSVSLELLHEHGTAELVGGDEFVTLYLAVDPFTPPANAGD